MGLLFFFIVMYIGTYLLTYFSLSLSISFIDTFQILTNFIHIWWRRPLITIVINGLGSTLNPRVRCESWLLPSRGYLYIFWDCILLFSSLQLFFFLAINCMILFSTLKIFDYYFPYFSFSCALSLWEWHLWHGFPLSNHIDLFSFP